MKMSCVILAKPYSGFDIGNFILVPCAEATMIVKNEIGSIYPYKWDFDWKRIRLGKTTGIKMP